MADPKGFMTTPRETPARRPVDVRIRDWREVYNDFPAGRLERQAGQFLPDLIVANVKPVSVGIRRVVAAIKQASPSAKVILTCPVEDFARAARKHGADACLNDEDVAGHLLRMACALSDRPKVVNAGN